MALSQKERDLVKRLVADMRKKGKKYDDLNPRGKALLDAYRAELRGAKAAAPGSYPGEPGSTPGPATKPTPRMGRMEAVQRVIEETGGTLKAPATGAMSEVQRLLALPAFGSRAIEAGLTRGRGYRKVFEEAGIPEKGSFGPAAIASAIAAGVLDPMAGAGMLLGRAKMLAQAAKLKPGATAATAGTAAAKAGAPVAKRTPPKPAPGFVKAIRESLEESTLLRPGQEEQYAEELGRRVRNYERIKGRGTNRTLSSIGAARRQALQGELPKAPMVPIGNKLDMEAVDEMARMVDDAPVLSRWERVTGTKALEKVVIGEWDEQAQKYVAHPLQPSEIEILGRVFGRPFAEQLRQAAGLSGDAERLATIANIPRALRATLDLSAPLRQGIAIAPHKPKEFIKAFVKMHGYWGSEREYEGLVTEIVADERTYELAKKVGLSLNAVWEKGGGLLSREEYRMGGELLERFGPIRAANRAYTGFLTKLRWDVFKSMALDLQNAGVNIYKPENLKVAQDLAAFVNASTGRGSLGALEKSAGSLSATLFAPRLVASRVQMMFRYYNPLTYARASVRHDPVRRQAAKAMLKFYGLGMSILSLASQVPGVEVGTNFRDADFGKIKIRGKTRLDVWGGMQQFARYFARMGDFIYRTQVKQEVPKYGEYTGWDITKQFIQSKLAPGIPTMVGTTLAGRTFEGEPLTGGYRIKELVSQFLPLFSEDVWDLIKEDPKSLIFAPLAFYGMNVQSYTPYKERRKPKRHGPRPTRPRLTPRIGP